VTDRGGWICPVCSRGVSPDEKTCSHTEKTQSMNPFLPVPKPTFLPTQVSSPMPYQRAPVLDYPGQMKGPLDEPASIAISDN
jgi:hypothetical protein